MSPRVTTAVHNCLSFHISNSFLILIWILEKMYTIFMERKLVSLISHVMVVWDLIAGDLIALQHRPNDTLCLCHSVILSIPLQSESDIERAITFIHIINLLHLIGYGLLPVPSRALTSYTSCEPTREDRRRLDPVIRVQFSVHFLFVSELNSDTKSLLFHTIRQNFTQKII